VERYQESVPAARAAVAIGAAIGSWVSSSNSFAALHEMVADLFTSSSKDDATNETWCQLPNVQHGVVVGQLFSRLAIMMTKQHGINLKCAMGVEFVRILRETWQAKVLLPWMGIGKDGMMDASDKDPLDGISVPPPDFRFNLLHQKLQMLNLCISRRVRSPMSRRQSEAAADILDFVDSDDEFYDTLEESPAVGVLKPLDNEFRLFDDSQCINIPKTQDPTPLTEDMAKQQQEILAKLGVSAESTLLRQHIQSASMLSDMQAFKAANPQSCLADFIRWYSPRDWIPEAAEEFDNVSSFAQGRLSERMHESNIENPTNPWHKMWAQATPMAADKQRALFDPVLEAEKIFDYLDTISPKDLFHHVLIAMLSNLSVYGSGLDNVELLPSVQNAIISLQTACEKAVGALDDEIAGIHEVTEEEHQVFIAIADDALEKVLTSLQTVEMLVAINASLSHFLPGASQDFLDSIATSTPSSSIQIDSKQDQSIVANLFWKNQGPTTAIHRNPERREYTLRCAAPRPFYSTQTNFNPIVVSRFFAQVDKKQVRYALALVDTEF
ncbi:Rab3 GTPase-activating protein catalytic subunit, partial [Thraustotheca clavata]